MENTEIFDYMAAKLRDDAEQYLAHGPVSDRQYLVGGRVEDHLAAFDAIVPMLSEPFRGYVMPQMAAWAERMRAGRFLSGLFVDDDMKPVAYYSYRTWSGWQPERDADGTIVRWHRRMFDSIPDYMAALGLAESVYTFLPPRTLSQYGRFVRPTSQVPAPELFDNEATMLGTQWAHVYTGRYGEDQVVRWDEYLNCYHYSIDARRAARRDLRCAGR